MTKTDAGAFSDSFSCRLGGELGLSGMSVSELSRRTGIHANTLHCYMRGEHLPNAYNLMRMCAALGCSADSLIGLRST